MIPHSTYRLQLHQGFDFDAVHGLIAYLRDLGIGAVYLSPILLAKPGSRHGYDICDHHRINPELGGEAGFERLAQALRSHGLGCLLDFVPNHMGADPASNPWWWDVLENGPSSPFAAFFDIDWEPIKPDLRGKVLLPVLGDQYGRVLNRGELRLSIEAGALVLCYWENRFPINPRMVPLVLGMGLGGEIDRLPFDADGDAGMEYLSILSSLRNLPTYLETDPALVRERQREKEVARKRLAELMERSPPVAAYVEQRIADFNGRGEGDDRFDRLHDLLERQTYRLAFWKTAGHEINYRRFFDINSLLGVRMENPEAFAATHEKLIELFRAHRITGVRLDHIDGLYHPAEYLHWLRAALSAASPAAVPEISAGTVGEDQADAPPYVVVEKILTDGESLRADWPVQGTTGYEYLNDINGLFVNPKGVRVLETFYRRFTGWNGTFAEEVRRCKRLILATSLASDLNVLANQLDRLSEADRNSRDFTLEALRDALREVIAAFPRYRTYGSEAGYAPEDMQVIDRALQSAAQANPAMDDSIFTFLRAVLLPFEPLPAHAPGASIPQAARLAFANKFQQLTSPVQAKGVEDTAFYRRAVLLSRNEVGGDPDSTGPDAGAFHAQILSRQRHFPFGLIASATHDTKRGEDARARLNVVAEMPHEWKRMVSRLARFSPWLPARVKSAVRISKEDEYILLQSLVGCWPMEASGAPREPEADFSGRVLAFLVKAAREAKTHTSWINPNAEYENALRQHLEGLLFGRGRERFTAAFFPFVSTVARLGVLRSLGQVAIKCALPGVPDIYQGTENWDLSLVDPDNRRPVDFEARRARGSSLEALLQPEDPISDRREKTLALLSQWPSGAVKFYALARCLRWRQRFPDLFLRGAYLPLTSAGVAKAPWLAFGRARGEEFLIAVTRVLGPSQGEPYPHWLPTGDPESDRILLPPSLSPPRWSNLFTGTVFEVQSGVGGRGLDMQAVTQDFPIAWLIGCRD